jgi:hypothetical protein
MSVLDISQSAFDFTHAPFPQYAQLAAALLLTPLLRRCRNRKRLRFRCRTIIALTRRRTCASMTRSPSTASDVQSRKCDIHPVRYRLASFIQVVMERPQFGGVISRMVACVVGASRCVCHVSESADLNQEMKDCTWDVKDCTWDVADCFCSG